MNDMDRRRDEWHIKKEVTWGHLVSTVLLAAGLISVYVDMNDRIDINANGITQNAIQIEYTQQIHGLDKNYHEKDMTEVRQQNQEALKKIDATIDKIDKKLDKLIDKQHTHN